MQKNVRKKGVAAVMQQMGVTDPDIERIVTEAMQSGHIADENALISRVSELVARKQAAAAEESDSEPESLNRPTLAAPSGTD